MAIVSSKLEEQSTIKPLNNMNSLWVIVWTITASAGMIGYLLWENHKKKVYNVARATIEHFKKDEANLLEAITFYGCTTYLKHLADALTLEELIRELPGFSTERVKEIKIFLAPHIMRCKSAEDLKKLERALATINFKIEPCHLAHGTEKKWLRFSPSYLTACSRFKKIHEPKWGRRIIEQFGKTALQNEEDEYTIICIRDSFDFVYSSPTEFPVVYCPIYYLAWNRLLTIFEDKIKSNKNLNWFMFVLTETSKSVVGKYVYNLAYDCSIKLARSLSLDEVITTLGEGDLTSPSKAEARKIIEHRILLAEEKELEHVIATTPDKELRTLACEVLAADFNVLLPA